MLYAIDVGTILATSDGFLNAIMVTPIIIGAYVFNGVGQLYIRGIDYKKQTIYISSIILLSGMLNIVLNVYFIDYFGPDSSAQVAAWTTFISYFIMMLLSILVTTFVLKLPPLPLGQMLKHMLFLSGIMAINYIWGAPSTGLHIGWMAFKAVLFLGLALLLFYNKIYLFLDKNSQENNTLDAQ